MLLHHRQLNIGLEQEGVARGVAVHQVKQVVAWKEHSHFMLSNKAKESLPIIIHMVLGKIQANNNLSSIASTYKKIN